MLQYCLSHQHVAMVLQRCGNDVAMVRRTMRRCDDATMRRCDDATMQCNAMTRCTSCCIIPVQIASSVDVSLFSFFIFHFSDFRIF